MCSARMSSIRRGVDERVARTSLCLRFELPFIFLYWSFPILGFSSSLSLSLVLLCSAAQTKYKIWNPKPRFAPLKKPNLEKRSEKNKEERKQSRGQIWRARTDQRFVTVLAELVLVGVGVGFGSLESF